MSSEVTGTLTRTGRKADELKHSSSLVVADRAALSVGILLRMDGESCQVHDGEKVGKSAVGALVDQKL